MIFILGSLSFYLLLGAALIILLCMVEFEKNGWATFTISATLGLICFFNEISIAAVLANPLWLAVGLGGYAIVGMTWSLIKWFLFVRARAETYNNVKNTFIDGWVRGQFQSNGTREEDRAAKTAEVGRSIFLNRMANRNLSLRVNDSYYDVSDLEQPKPSQYKNKLIGWISYWPFSLINTFFFQFINNLFKNLYKMLYGLYGKIVEAVYGDIASELKNRQPVAAVIFPAPVEKTSGVDFGT